MQGPQAALKLVVLRQYLGRGAEMSLWDLLTLVCFIMPIASSNVVAKNAHLSFFHHFIVLLVAVAMGGVCAWTMRVAGKIVVRRTADFSTIRKEWCLRALYGTALLWCGAALFFGGWVARHLLLASL
jgi:hypothetical protein